ncbi:hypothetical protein [uncultured Desulfobacter sp.]|uniref:hypothetical protein n=1 Tax=uncultured Desulfobacter sp. TaxID=240139 RepID=UPI002AAAB7C9|nr:hypothetical protein [uncultured Desulfobacter sp.]
MNFLRFQQYAHLILLFILIFIYLLCNKVNSQGAKGIKTIQTIIQIGGFGWTAFLSVIAVRHGISLDFPKKLFQTYRQALTKLFYVTALNVVLVIGIGVLSYHLTFYRDVEFLSNKKADLLLNDVPGKVLLIAKLEKGKQTKVRLKYGLRLLVARSGKELLAIDDLKIQPRWKKQVTDIIKIEFPENSYEKTL